MVVDIGLVAAVVGTAATVRVVAQQIRLSRRDRLHTELMRAELERYMAHAIGHRPKGRLYAPTGHER